MREATPHGLLLFDPEKLFYLTGFETIGYSTFALGLVPASGEPLLLVREMEQVGARRSSWLATDPAIYHDDEEPSEAAVGLLRAQGLAGARIGLNTRSRFLPVDAYRRMQAGLETASYVDEPGLVEGARMLKSPLEIDYIRRAARYPAKRAWPRRWRRSAKALWTTRLVQRQRQRSSELAPNISRRTQS